MGQGGARVKEVHGSRRYMGGPKMEKGHVQWGGGGTR